MDSLLCSSSRGLGSRPGGLAVPQARLKARHDLGGVQHFSLHAAPLPLQLCSHLQPHSHQSANSTIVSVGLCVPVCLLVEGVQPLHEPHSRHPADFPTLVCFCPWRGFSLHTQARSCTSHLAPSFLWVLLMAGPCKDFSLHGALLHQLCSHLQPCQPPVSRPAVLHSSHSSFLWVCSRPAQCMQGIES